MEYQKRLYICLFIIGTSIIYGLSRESSLNLEILTAVGVGIVASLFATIFYAFIFWPRTKDLNNMIERALANSTGTPQNIEVPIFARQVTRIDRNLHMGEAYWLDVLDDLDTARDPVYFSGGTMGLWLEPGPYERRLRQGFKARLLNATLRGEKNEDFFTSIAINNESYFRTWESWLSSCVREAAEQAGMDVDKFSARAYKKFVLLELPSDRLTYSAVLCGHRLAVTVYVSTGRAHDSPTMDVAYRSDIWNLYVNDITGLSRELRNLKLSR